MADRYRTVLKKFYITESQNHALSELICYTGFGNFSRYARNMLFKKKPIVIHFDEKSFENLVFALRRIKNNLNQLSRIAEQTQNLQALQALTYSTQLVSRYEKELTKGYRKKKERLLSKVD